MWPSAEAQSSARNRKSKRVRVRSIACTQCAQIGDTGNVPQQDTVNGTQSTGHRPRFARQAASNAATVHGETTVRQELITHLNCLNRAVQLLLLSAVCIVQELFSTSGACCFLLSL